MMLGGPVVGEARLGSDHINPIWVHSLRFDLGMGLFDRVGAVLWRGREDRMMMAAERQIWQRSAVGGLTVVAMVGLGQVWSAGWISLISLVEAWAWAGPGLVF
ncbi:hypothetical protein RchiOBHm_Chr2g0104491 [Rosa chinensis]|uniref:Uncharacterized protein n=1 Tax=Rosa chinensis TaxID=74649 RepID=A0A2P6RN71_ROSCH|nr:hypothetical protein RchiOBHm_Chr2g0104491 [Rosa chinensis]